ncbi:MAG: hypothetical protein P1S60_13280 [Anaerolineae bacterium]|nr:hypothetical protein [Anaerolineae bacterium]
MLTLVGPSGIGKTRLALEAVKPVMIQYQQGTYFIALALVKQRLGGLAMAMGQTQLGIQFAEESLHLRREIGNAIEIAAGLYSLAIRKISVVQHQQAVDLLTECIALYENSITYELPYAMLGWAQMLMGDYVLGHQNAQYAFEMNQE